MKINVGIEGGWSYSQFDNKRTLRIRAIDPVSGITVTELELTEQQVLGILSNSGRSGKADGTFEMSEANLSRVGKHRVLATVTIPCRPDAIEVEMKMSLIADLLPFGPWYANEPKYNHHRFSNGVYKAVFVAYLDTVTTEDDLNLHTDIGYDVDYYVCKKEYDDVD